MTSEGKGDTFEGDFADTRANTLLLVSMVGKKLRNVIQDRHVFNFQASQKCLKLVSLLEP
jgi:hypothetical protein